MELATLSDQSLLAELESLVRIERTTTSEIVVAIKEVDNRRLYLKMGHTSLFSYLTKGLGYTPSAAQRRIDSARLMQTIPALQQDLASGRLNIMQVSMLEGCVRQKRKSEPFVFVDKEKLLEKIKNHDLRDTQRILAQELDLEVKDYEKARVQKDDSIRLEMTLTQAQAAAVARVRELVSHVNPNPSWSELFAYLAEEFIERKDPTRTAKTKAATGQVSSAGRSVPAATRRAVFRRDKTCRWVDSRTGSRCESRFQLQVDHIRSLWRGGGSELDNLQLLCSAHNQLKYRLEAGLDLSAPGQGPP